MCEFHGYLLLLNYIPKETTQKCKTLKAYELMFWFFSRGGGGVDNLVTMVPTRKKSTFTTNNNIKNQYHTRLL